MKEVSLISPADLPERPDEEKVAFMQRFQRLATVRHFLEHSLGGYPRTAEEWVVAYDLLMEHRRSQ